MLKILEGTGISITMYANGHIRQATGSYLGVSILIITCALAGGVGAFYLHWRVQQRSEADEPKDAQKYDKPESAPDTTSTPNDSELQEMELTEAEQKGSLMTYAGVMEVQEDQVEEIDNQESTASASSGTRKRLNYKL